MKKLYTTPEYKLRQRRRVLKIEKRIRKKRFAFERGKRTGELKNKKKSHLINDIKFPVDAP